MFEAGSVCFPDNSGNTGVTLTSDASGNGAASFQLTLPYLTYTGDSFGDGQGSESFVLVLDNTLSTGSGDRANTKAIAIPGPPTCNGKPANIVGTNASETLAGTASDDVIVGLGGNDTISGGAGNDTICGGPGSDSLNGNDGSDTLDGGTGADVVSGGGGTDIATYAIRTSGVTVSLDNLANDGDSSDGPTGARDNAKSDIENLIGSSGADTLTGSAAINTLDGRNGADVLNGLGGIDTATYATRTAGVTVTLDNVANDGNSADGSADNVNSDIENLIGGSGADTLTGSPANNSLDGRNGADALSGLGGTDAVTYATRTAGMTVTLDNVANDGNSGDGPAGARDNVKSDIENLIGGGGADSLSGSAANNRLTGGPGADSMSGVGGNDTLFANDGVADTTIDCDGGTADTAHVDSGDPPPIACETVGP
jgi:Ca2+-binding RTX toxin-like protein